MIVALPFTLGYIEIIVECDIKQTLSTLSNYHKAFNCKSNNTSLHHIWKTIYISQMKLVKSCTNAIYVYCFLNLVSSGWHRHLLGII